MEEIGVNIKLPLLPGRRVWVVSRGEIIPMKVSVVSVREHGISMTIVYDGDDPKEQRWNISELTEKDIGYLFFLDQDAAEAFRDISLGPKKT